MFIFYKEDSPRIVNNPFPYFYYLFIRHVYMYFIRTLFTIPSFTLPSCLTCQDPRFLTGNPFVDVFLSLMSYSSSLSSSFVVHGTETPALCRLQNLFVSSCHTYSVSMHNPHLTPDLLPSILYSNFSVSSTFITS